MSPLLPFLPWTSPVKEGNFKKEFLAQNTQERRRYITATKRNLKKHRQALKFLEQGNPNFVSSEIQEFKANNEPAGRKRWLALGKGIIRVHERNIAWMKANIQ